MDDVLKLITIKMAQHKPVPRKIKKYLPKKIGGVLSHQDVLRMLTAQKVFNRLNK